MGLNEAVEGYLVACINSKISEREIPVNIVKEYVGIEASG